MSEELTNTEGELTESQDPAMPDFEEVSSDMDVSQFTDEEYVPIEILSNDGSMESSLLPATEEEPGQFSISRYMESMPMPRDPVHWSPPQTSGRRILHARRRLGQAQFETPTPIDSPASSGSDDGVNRSFLLPQLIAEEAARAQLPQQDPEVGEFAQALFNALLKVQK